jgi:tetratricopeptide (TPR) repeat protein
MKLLSIATICFAVMSHQMTSAQMRTRQPSSTSTLVTSIKQENTNIESWSPSIIQLPENNLILVVPKVAFEKPPPSYVENLKSLTRTETFSELLSLLNDGDPRQQAGAAWAISIHKSNKFNISLDQKNLLIQTLTKLLRSSTSQVIYTAAMALASLGSAAVSSVDSLIAIVDSDQTSEVRVAAIVGLWRIGENTTSVDLALKKASQEPNSKVVRRAAEQAISKIRKSSQGESNVTNPPNPEYTNLQAAFDSLAHTKGEPIDADQPPADLNPNALALKNEGTSLYYQKNQFHEGARMLQKALEIDPRIPSAYNTIMLYYLTVKNDAKTAQEYLERGSEHCPNSPSVHFDLGSVYAQLGEHAKAIEQYKFAEKLGWANKASVFYNMGNAYVKLDRKNDAITAYCQALSKDKMHFNARRNLIIAYMQTNKTTLAREEAQRLLELNPNGRFGTWAREALQKIP